MSPQKSPETSSREGLLKSGIGDSTQHADTSGETAAVTVQLSLHEAVLVQHFIHKLAPWVRIDHHWASMIALTNPD